MESRPTALIISNFPIVAATARAVFASGYSVHASNWTEYAQAPVYNADFVIIDVTTVDVGAALALLTGLVPGARIVVCSLHQNEIEVYHTDGEGLQPEGELPSLLTLTA